MPTPQLTAPYRGFRFRIEISGIQIASFSEATIPSSTIATVQYREGTDPVYQRSLSGLTEYTTVTLKKGLTDTMDLYNWHRLVSEKGSGAAEAQKNVTITLMDTDGTDKASWNVINAWPTKYETSGLNAANSEVMVETLELSIDYMQRVK